MKFMNDLFAQRRSAVRAATFLSLLAASFTLACSSDPPGLQFPGQCSEGQIVCDGVCVAGPVCNAAPGAGGVVGGTGAASSIGGSTGGILTGGGGLGPAAGGGVSTGGAIGVGGGGPGTGGGATTECAINITKSEFGMIQTVGVVEFTTDATPVSAAIEFGLDTTYGMTAPVDLAEPNYKTYLLGMTAETTYHYRVAVTTAAGTCYSPDQTIQTGQHAASAPTSFAPEAGPSSAAPAQGFITGSSGLSGTFGFIFNQDGEVVWAYRFPTGQNCGFGASGITRVLMSWDGKYMYARDLGPFNDDSCGAIYRVDMDGTNQITLNVSGGHHHDLTVTPTGIAYIGKLQVGECDHIMVADPDGSNSHSLIDLWEVFQYFPDQGQGMGEKCHVNAIHYSADGDFFTVSDREKDVIAKISGDGTILQTIGRAPDQSQPYAVTADGTSGGQLKWRVQHGHHLYEDNKLVVFSNGPLQGGTSRLLHYTINGGTATLDWEYSEMGNSPTQGDAQALPNGNFLVTNSQGGNMDELDPNHVRIRRYKASTGGVLGYTNHRPTLYGPPPH